MSSATRDSRRTISSLCCDVNLLVRFFIWFIPMVRFWTPSRWFILFHDVVRERPAVGTLVTRMVVGASHGAQYRLVSGRVKFAGSQLCAESSRTGSVYLSSASAGF